MKSFSSLSSFLWEEKTRGLMQCGCRLMKVSVFSILGVRSRMSVFIMSLSFIFFRFFLVRSASCTYNAVLFSSIFASFSWASSFILFSASADSSLSSSSLGSLFMAAKSWSSPCINLSSKFFSMCVILARKAAFLFSMLLLAFLYLRGRGVTFNTFLAIFSSWPSSNDF